LTAYDGDGSVRGMADTQAPFVYPNEPTIKTEEVDRRLYASVPAQLNVRTVHSQSGEDGVISWAFEIIGERSKWCVEFGAWDGVYLSNACNLIRNAGWSALMIEGDPKALRRRGRSSDVAARPAGLSLPTSGRATTKPLEWHPRASRP
jgi:hypothetical protein